MPTQDAVEIAMFLAETQKLFARFSAGSNVVGGELDVAAVTKHEGFKWINANTTITQISTLWRQVMSDSRKQPPYDPMRDRDVKLPPLIKGRFQEVGSGSTVMTDHKVTDEDLKKFGKAIRRALDL